MMRHFSIVRRTRKGFCSFCEYNLLDFPEIDACLLGNYRYLNYTMLIYRPSVEAARRRYTPLEAPSAPSCMVQVTMTSASACMAACCELVELTTANYASGDKYAWWWYDATRKRP